MTQDSNDVGPEEVAANVAAGNPHHDTPFPLGRIGTTILLLSPPALFALGLSALGDPLSAGTWLWFFPIYFVIALGTAFRFNFTRSRFQAQRDILGSYLCGVSPGYLTLSGLPTGRLLLYRDALEVRATFQRYLVPYAKMKVTLDEGTSFLSTYERFLRPVVITSDLPGVPKRLKVVLLNGRAVLEEIQSTREAITALEDEG